MVIHESKLLAKDYHKCCQAVAWAGTPVVCSKQQLALQHHDLTGCTCLSTAAYITRLSTTATAKIMSLAQTKKSCWWGRALQMASSQTMQQAWLYILITKQLKAAN